jgi:hypothetical protein
MRIRIIFQQVYALVDFLEGGATTKSRAVASLIENVVEEAGTSERN